MLRRIKVICRKFLNPLKCKSDYAGWKKRNYFPVLALLCEKIENCSLDVTLFSGNLEVQWTRICTNFKISLFFSCPLHLICIKCKFTVFRHKYSSFLSDNGPSLGWRESFNKPYQWLNYNEALLRAKNFGSGLVACGLTPGSNTHIGIYAQNCPEWILTEQGSYCYSMVIVPLYDTLGPEACAFIIKQGKHYTQVKISMKIPWEI